MALLVPAYAQSERSKGQDRLVREVRHELVMLPFYGVFDNLSFKVDGHTVTLLGQVTRPTLKSDAENVVKGIEGVEKVDNQLQVLPLSPNDDRIRIAAEIEKISLWLGPDVSRSAPVEAAAVRALVAGSGLLSGWELADAITSRDRAGAIAAARRLVDSGDEPIRIVGGLASRVRALITAKAMTEAGAPAKTVVDAARAWYFRDALAAGLKKYTLRELLAMPRQLLAVDRSFKSRSLDKGAVLEALVVTLTSPSVENR
jgi:hypothetical protein